MAAPTRVLAIDPSLRSSGFALLTRENGKIRALDYGAIRNPAALLQSGCLVAIHEKISDLIAEYAPECAAVESVIFVQSYKTAITLGCARGAALVALAQRGLQIFEYAPRRVKQAVVGRGAAEKSQVGFMVRVLLGLSETPPPDAADALAIGITHFHSVDSAQRGASTLERL